MLEFQLTAPVALIIFKRVEATTKVFDVIRKAKPTKLLIVADGPRLDRPSETDECIAVRKIVEQVDWNCEVLTNYSDVNLGMAKRFVTGLNWIFEQVEEAIILEDDCVPRLSFFRYCQELLERYRFDTRIASISALYFAQENHQTDHSYYFSLYFHGWSWATWRRAWQWNDFDMTHWQKTKQNRVLYNILQDKRAAKSWESIFEATYIDQIITWDYQWMLSCWLQESIHIHPSTHLADYIGFDEHATNTTVNMHPKVYSADIQFPLNHPPSVIRDTSADSYLQTTLFDLTYLQRLKYKIKKLLFLKKSLL